MRLVSTLMIVLIGATSASAECAWVLWRKDPRQPPPHYQFVEGHQHYYQIVEAFTGLGSAMNSLLAQGKCEDRRKQLMLALPGKSGTEYVCLPDTVDPRRVKK